MGEPEYYCPHCRDRLRRVSRRQDYFCQACHSVVEILDGDRALVQRDVKLEETIIPVEQLHAQLNHENLPVDETSR